MALGRYCIALFILSLFIIAACPRENPLSRAAASGSGISSISRTLLIVLTVGIALVVVVFLTIMLILLTKWVNNREILCDDPAREAFWDSRNWGYLQVGHNMLNFHKLVSDESQMLEKRPGANGSAYRVVSKTGNAFVIKRLNGVIQDKALFEHHITHVSDDTYIHNVPLRAFFYTEQEKMLVYDYMQMGSLYGILHVRKIALQWKTRWFIALGAARGIARIHKRNLVHGSIKSTNIMFGRSYEIRVTENSLSDMMAPTQTGPPSQDSDVRDFGVVLLELISRKDPEILRQLLDRDSVVTCLHSLMNEQTEQQHIRDFLDPELRENHAAWGQILHLLLLAIECTRIPVFGQLSMANVVGRIKFANLIAGEEFCDSFDTLSDEETDEIAAAPVPTEPLAAPVPTEPRRSQRLRDRETPTPRRSSRLLQRE